MEPEPTLRILLNAINTLSLQVGSLQDQVKSQGKTIQQLLAVCKETNNLARDKDQGQAKLGPAAGPSTPPDQQGGQANTPKTVRPWRQGLGDPFQAIRSTVGYNSEEEEEPRQEIKKEPCRASRGLSSLTPFDEAMGTKHLKMELPDPYKGNTRGCKATQWLDHMLLWVALHQHQFDKEEQMIVWILYCMEDKAANWTLPLINNIIKGKGSTPKTIKTLGLQFKEAFADPDTKRAMACKIAILVQTTSTAEYVTKFQNLIAELDWNKEVYIAQLTRGLHWKVKELLSTKDNIPEEYKAIFAAAIKIDNMHCKNEENCPKKVHKALVTATTSTTTTHRVCLSKDPNYITLEEQDCYCAAGLCVKCG
ncbi:Retrotransposon gag protein [Rhizoctonia solani]|uniref:Retrotransposon gag protein n=1 Tax=Rhizoctonia solani TaxID=456999 RepID=A0A8H7LMR8_9AGAM|nr:Retrotransposon gag protein [Rhizoctonia solani]